MEQMEYRLQKPNSIFLPRSKDLVLLILLMTTLQDLTLKGLTAISYALGSLSAPNNVSFTVA